MKLHIKGYPEQIGEYIEFPSDEELLRMPMFAKAPAEWIQKNGSFFQKELLDKAPISSNAKHIYVFSQIRYVYPGILINKIECPDISTRNEWHCDSVRSKNIVHIISSSLPTEFNTKEFHMDIPDHANYDWFCRHSATNSNEWGLEAKSAPAKQFVTFTTNIHRAPLPIKSEYRYFMRIIEADNVLKSKDDSYTYDTSIVYKNNKEIPNIEQRGNEVIVHPLK